MKFLFIRDVLNHNLCFVVNNRLYNVIPSYAGSRSGCIDGRYTSDRAPSAHRCGRRRAAKAARESLRLGSQHDELCCRLRPDRHATKCPFSTPRYREKVDDG